MTNKEIMLIGFDIHRFVKNMCNELLKENPSMTDGEKMAYRLGIDNTLGFLKQTLSEAIKDDDDYYRTIAVHVPGLDVMTEFMTIEEVLQEFSH